MTDKLISQTIEKYSMLERGDTVVIGLSGGADSVTLTHFLHSIAGEYNLHLIAAHINHGIRGDEADRDENFCKAFCEKLGVEFRALHADIPSLSKELKMSQEECGRKVRYDFFNSVCNKKGKIATAHNLNDKAETILLNITRGAGLNGLCGIPPVRDNIIRPLIETDRETIEKYCLDNSLSYVTDSTNLSNDYSRNKIRNLVIPVLSLLNPSVMNAFSRLSQCASCDEEYISGNAIKAYGECQNDNRLIETKLQELDASVRNRVISMFLYNNGCKDVSLKNIEDVVSVSGTGRQVVVSNAVTVRSRNGYIEIVGSKADSWSVPLKKENYELKLPYGKAIIKLYDKKDLQNLNKELLDNLIDCDRISNASVMRSRLDGDSITLIRRNVTKPLKKLFNEEKIPPEARNSISVLSDADKVVWVEGFGVSKKYAVNNNTQFAMQITVVRGKDNDYR